MIDIPIPNDSMSAEYINSGIIIKVIINIIIVCLLIFSIISIVKRKNKRSVILFIISVLLAVCSMMIPYVKYTGGFAGLNETDSFWLSYNNWNNKISFREKELLIRGFGKLGVVTIVYCLIALIKKELINKKKKANESIKAEPPKNKMEKK